MSVLTSVASFKERAVDICAITALSLIVEGTPLPHILPPFGEAVATLLSVGGRYIAVATQEGYLVVDCLMLKQSGTTSSFGEFRIGTIPLVFDKPGRSQTGPLKYPNDGASRREGGGLEYLPAIALLDDAAHQILIVSADDWSKVFTRIETKPHGVTFSHTICALPDQQSVAVTCVSTHVVYVFDIVTGNLLHKALSDKTHNNWVTGMISHPPTNELMVADLDEHKVWSIDASTGVLKGAFPSMNGPFNPCSSTSSDHSFSVHSSVSSFRFTTLAVLGNEIFLWDDYSKHECCVIDLATRSQVLRHWALPSRSRGGGMVALPHLNCLAFNNVNEHSIDLIDPKDGKVIASVTGITTKMGIVTLDRVPKNVVAGVVDAASKNEER